MRWRVKTSLALGLMGLWLLAAWPPLWLEPRVPPKIRSVQAATVTKTFSFSSTAEGFVGTSGGKSNLTYDSGTGNPAGSLKTSSTGRNNSDISNWTWSGTWEDLGVPSGATVTQIRLNSGYTRVTSWSIVDSITIGAYKLRDASDVDQATLWTGRTPTGVDGDWVAISQQADQAVPGGIGASSSSIKLYWERTVDLGNDKNATASFYEDEISLVVSYNPPVAVSISLSTDGSVGFGYQALNSTQDTTAGGLNDVETVSVDSGPADLDIRSGNFSDGGNTWSLESSNGSNQVLWEFSGNGSSWTSMAIADNLYSLASSVSQGGTQDVYLRLTTPTDTSSYDQHSATVTIVASAP